MQDGFLHEMPINSPITPGILPIGGIIGLKTLNIDNTGEAKAFLFMF